jgi:major membrane immunogen (membrane-anchored lipoprotein)
MNMKRILIFAGIFLLGAISGDVPYKDGHYKGTSRAQYLDEEYYGHAHIVVENGKIIQIDFLIRDSAKRVNFDEKYEKYFAGNDLYVQQCRNDWKGIQSYPDSLLKHQDPDMVDAISGATWSYNIFKASVKEALIHARQEER